MISPPTACWPYSIVLVLVMLFRPGGIFGRWEFSLTRLLDGIRHPKALRKERDPLWQHPY